MKIKRILFAICVSIISACQAKPEVFFEDIYVGDDIETCLAKGCVQYKNNDPSSFKLSPFSQAMQYFTYSDVSFGENGIIKEIYLSYRQLKGGRSALDVFNYMTQYFSQRYDGMKTQAVNEDKIHPKYNMKYNQEGMQVLWESSKVKISLISSYNTPDYTPVAPKAPNEVNFDWGAGIADEIRGNWVELSIIAK